MSLSEVDLGFAEECEEWKLKSHFFPSKIGGKPAWLDLVNIPDLKDLTCSSCQNQLLYLCQIYAPITDKEDCFHRTLFLFICRTATCFNAQNSIGIKVLRNQLARDNICYNYYPSEENIIAKPKLDWQAIPRLCIVCGCRSTKHCANCGEVNYCCREHQKIHWTLHKKECRKVSTYSEEKSNILFPEFELLIEAEENHNNPEELEEGGKMQKKYKEYQNKKNEFKDSELLSFASEDKDKQFTKFRSVISGYHDQVLRYQRGGKPLWISSQNQLEEGNIPPCQYCGSPRIFEFQIMPQMLHYLALETSNSSMDWGILIVYACSQSCNGSQAYKEEYVWRQDIST